MTLQGLYQELSDLNETEVQTIFKMVQALKRTRVSPLAYIEELMNFRALGFDHEKNKYIHRMLITDELTNRYQILHGGVTATFIDTAMGSTVFQDMGDDTRVVTLDMSVNFLAPGENGWLDAETEIIKKGKTVLVMETKVNDERQRLIASASATFFLLK
ncbi:PaaI family thioesterase [Hazenella sp. IB182357]|uniref:PaaI family thioesterase n=1 Tax=Polycladospora coralii TaxID=2771432 RepID=A0A926N7C4_9BACL|nr:PaaI family thioesterase [Polycladospora coralii]MBD1370942.1 PaaI family thioesterase [Polycladospora coralii]MBS7529881.1 PaaI family thioesterase [Polycladospora coralii]